MAEHLFGFHTIEETLRKGVSGASLLISRENARIQKLREAAESRGVPVSEVEEGNSPACVGRMPTAAPFSFYPGLPLPSRRTSVISSRASRHRRPSCWCWTASWTRRTSGRS